MEIKKASKQEAKLRIGLSGASGFGKTYSGLLMAFGMTGDWSKICVIDTENNSASLYSNLGNYNVIDLQAPYNPEKFIDAMKLAENSGMEVILLDSLTSEWQGSVVVLIFTNNLVEDGKTGQKLLLDIRHLSMQFFSPNVTL